MFEDQTYSTHGFNFYQSLTKKIGLGLITLSTILFIAWYITGYANRWADWFHLNVFPLHIYFTAWITAYGVAGIYLFKLDRFAYQFFFFSFFITVVLGAGVIPYFIYCGINGHWTMAGVVIGSWLVLLAVQFIVAKLISRLVIYGVIK